MLDELLKKVMSHMQINNKDTVNSAEPVFDPYANNMDDLVEDDGISRLQTLPLLQARQQQHQGPIPLATSGRSASVQEAERQVSLTSFS